MDRPSGDILARRPLIADEPPINDANPRGGARGGRGLVRWGDRLVAATYHTLHILDSTDLIEVNRIRHRLRGPVRALLSWTKPAHHLWVTSTAIDGALLVDLATGEVEDRIASSLCSRPNSA